MIHNSVNRRLKLALALFAASLPFAGLGSLAAHAQNIIRSPSINIPSRIPTINPNLAGRAVTGVGNDNSLRIRSPCDAAYRDSNGECSGQPVTSTDGNSSASGRNKSSDTRRNALLASVNSRAVPNEIVVEIDGAADAFARRQGLTLLESQNFPLIGATIGLFRITGSKTVETAGREVRTDSTVRSFQPNFRYVLQDQNTELTEGDPAQYANAKLRLPQAHTLAHGANVTIAVIDSGIDLKHPEFAGSMISSFDALGSKEGPHVHGTGVAGAIASH